MKQRARNCRRRSVNAVILSLTLAMMTTTEVRGYIPEMIPPEIPSLFPLQYITPRVIAEFALDQSNRAIVSAIIPYDSNDMLAIFISEGVGGAFGGIAQRGISRIDGNKNKEGSELVSAGQSGAYFGIAGAVRSLAYTGGLSQLAVSLLALVTSFTVSEFIKIRTKTIEAQRSRALSSSISMYDLMKSRDPTLRDLMIFRETGRIPSSSRMPMLAGAKTTQVEVQADATQYTLLSILVPSGRNGGSLNLEDSVVIGAVCGLGGQLVRETRDREMEALRVKAGEAQGPRGQRPRGDFVLTRLARASVEGAAQLLTYQAARDYVRDISPYFNKLEPLVPLPLLPESSFSVGSLPVELPRLQQFFSLPSLSTLSESLGSLRHGVGPAVGGVGGIDSGISLSSSLQDVLHSLQALPNPLTGL